MPESEKKLVWKAVTHLDIKYEGEFLYPDLSFCKNLPSC
jgi:hypothetical protein